MRCRVVNGLYAQRWRFEPLPLLLRDDTPAGRPVVPLLATRRVDAEGEDDQRQWLKNHGELYDWENDDDYVRGRSAFEADAALHNAAVAADDDPDAPRLVLLIAGTTTIDHLQKDWVSASAQGSPLRARLLAVGAEELGDAVAAARGDAKGVGRGGAAPRRA